MPNHWRERGKRQERGNGKEKNDKANEERIERKEARPPVPPSHSHGAL